LWQRRPGHTRARKEAVTGERGEYALPAGQPAQPFLDTMAHVAEDSGGQVIAEQVWDHNPPAGPDTPFVPGENTFSATPLAWSHAQFIRLARSIDAGRPVETPQIVACRYDTTLCPP
jgi:glucoamylase